MTRFIHIDAAIRVDSDGEGERMVMDLQDVKSSLADGISKSNIQLFGTSTIPLSIVQDDSEDGGEKTSDDDSYPGHNIDSELDGESESSDDEADGDLQVENTGRTSLRQTPRSVHNLPAEAEQQEDADYASSDSDIGEFDIDPLGDDDDAPQWKTDLATRAQSTFYQHARRRRDWTKLIYQSDLTPEEILVGEAPLKETDVDPEADEDDEFFKVKQVDNLEVEVVDQTKEFITSESLAQWEDEALLDSIRHMFITGPSGAGDGDEPADNEYEDATSGLENLEAAAELGSPPVPDNDATGAAALAAKKDALKRKFDEQYDDPSAAPSGDFYTEKKDELARQLALNRAEFADIDPATRTLVEGFRPGAYVRIEIADVPCELVTHFDPAYPLIVGGLTAAEERMGFVQVRVKRHRWYTRPLKTNDPLILSLGWRRFQTIPIYALDDHSIRMRMLKYTPEHMHCYATFYGPTALPNTGFCAFTALRNVTTAFRIAATGVVLDVDRTTKIVKKLKLTGVPYKIFRNTAFVRDMFTSALEVAKFEGANIRTVAGVRGQIKKALAKPDGAFRATFEDKVLMSGA